MATSNIPSGIRCSKCNDIMFEYVELRCKHKLCPFCTRKGKLRDNKIVCFSQNCKKVSQKVPTFRSVIKDMRKTAIAEHKVTMKKKEEDCLEHVKLLEESVKELWEEEQKQMDLLSSIYDKQLKELKVHYRGLKRKAAGSFRKREGQIEKILTDIKNILTKIHDELKRMNDSIAKHENEEVPSENAQEEIKEMQQKTIEVASQTIEVEIPKMDIEIQVDGEMGLTDDIKIIAPEPELHVITTVKNDGDGHEQTDDVTVDAPEPELQTAISKDLDLDQISKMQWVRQEQSVKLPHIPNRLRLMPNNELWQCHAQGITVLDAELRFLREINKHSDGGTTSRFVWDVAGLHDGNVILAGSIGLLLVDYEGNVRHRIDNGHFTGVAERDGALYAAEKDTGSIRIFEHVGGWKESRRISLGCQKQIINISIQDNMIYVCLCTDSKILAYNLSGEQLESWGSEGKGEAGELNFPSLCLTGMGGAVLIADSGNNRLQVLGAGRQWSVVSLQPPVKRPMNALLYHGRLLVASGNDDTLYVYEPSDRDA